MAPVSLEGLLVLHGVIEFKQIFETNKMKVKTQQQNLIQGLDLSYQCITTELWPLGKHTGTAQMVLIGDFQQPLIYY